MQELWFLRSARCLMLIDIYMKFDEDSLNSFSYRAVTSVTDRRPGGKQCLPTLKGET